MRKLGNRIEKHTIRSLPTNIRKGEFRWSKTLGEKDRGQQRESWEISCVTRAGRMLELGLRSTDLMAHDRYTEFAQMKVSVQ